MTDDGTTTRQPVQGSTATVAVGPGPATPAPDDHRGGAAAASPNGSARSGCSSPVGC